MSELDNLKLAEQVEKAYRIYFLNKSKNTPTSGFKYESEVTKFIDWLRSKTEDSSAPKVNDKDV